MLRRGSINRIQVEDNLRGFRPPTTGGSAPQRRDTVRRKPNDAILFGFRRTMRAKRRSEASQLRSIDQRGLRRGFRPPTAGTSFYRPKGASPRGFRPPTTVTTFDRPKGASPRGFRPTKKDHPGIPAVRLDRRSVKGKYRRRIIHTQAQPKHNPSTTLPSPIPNPPSILTLYASPVKSYGGGAGVVFFRGAKPPLVYRA